MLLTLPNIRRDTGQGTGLGFSSCGRIYVNQFILSKRSIEQALYRPYHIVPNMADSLIELRSLVLQLALVLGPLPTFLLAVILTRGNQLFAILLETVRVRYARPRLLFLCHRGSIYK